MTCIPLAIIFPAVSAIGATLVLYLLWKDDREW